MSAKKQRDFKRLFVTGPHAAQEVGEYGNFENYKQAKPGNWLIAVRELTPYRRPAQEIVFTGEELDSLCEQWKKYKARA
jgi:hypothetical protein